MIISSGNDYRAAAQRRLPPFLFITLMVERIRNIP